MSKTNPTKHPHLIQKTCCIPIFELLWVYGWSLGGGVAAQAKSLHSDESIGKIVLDRTFSSFSVPDEDSTQKVIFANLGVGGHCSLLGDHFNKRGERVDSLVSDFLLI